MTDLVKLRVANAMRWNAMTITRPVAQIDAVAKRLCASTAKVRYQKIESRTGVPWWFIAVVHEREADQNWQANIAQGDRWDRVSTHVPAGRGPFESFEDAAVDALLLCPPFAGRNRDWTPGGALTMLELYNGMGYALRDKPSPYIWAGTDQYSSGKFISDHVFDPNAVDQQLGCAVLLRRMALIDGSVMGAGPLPLPPDIEPVPPKKAKKPIVAPVAAGGSILSMLYGFGAPLWIAVALALLAAIAWFVISRRN